MRCCFLGVFVCWCFCVPLFWCGDVWRGVFCVLVLLQLVFSVCWCFCSAGDFCVLVFLRAGIFSCWCFCALVFWCGGVLVWVGAFVFSLSLFPPFYNSWFLVYCSSNMFDFHHFCTNTTIIQHQRLRHVLYIIQYIKVHIMLLWGQPSCF